MSDNHLAVLWEVCHECVSRVTEYDTRVDSSYLLLTCARVLCTVYVCVSVRKRDGKKYRCACLSLCMCVRVSVFMVYRI